MKKEFHGQPSEIVPFWSRRGLLRQTGFLAMGFWGIGRAIDRVFPEAWAAELQRAASQPALRSPQRGRKSATELFKVLQTHPGGKQALEAAQKENSRLSMERLPSNLTRIPPFSVVLSPGHLKEGSNTVTLREVDVLSDTTFELKKAGKTQSHAHLKIAFPRYGWYLLNIEGTLKPNWGVSAGVREMRSPNFPGSVIQTWIYPKNSSAQPVVLSFPAVYEYKDNPYNKFGLEFYIESGGLLFQEVSVEAL